MTFIHKGLVNNIGLCNIAIRKSSVWSAEVHVGFSEQWSFLMDFLNLLGKLSKWFSLKFDGRDFSLR